MQPFETKSVQMIAQYRLAVQAPEADVSRIIAAICAITPLTVGAYDQNVFISPGGTEHYRPRQGAVAGEESEARRRPGVCEFSFQIAPDAALLERIVEAVFQVHSYQEPVIMVQQILASRSKGLDDSANPHRWWNTTGDWKRND